MIAIIIVLVLIIIIFGLIGFAIYKVTNMLDNSPKGLGESCKLSTDCANWGPNPGNTACCKGVCANKINNWCAHEGPNVGADIGQSCAVPTDCKNHNLFVGSPGTSCCNGTCQDKRRDWANNWYCPNECRGGALSGAGTCA